MTPFSSTLRGSRAACSGSLHGVQEWHFQKHQGKSTQNNAQCNRIRIARTYQTHAGLILIWLRTRKEVFVLQGSELDRPSLNMTEQEKHKVNIRGDTGRYRTLRSAVAPQVYVPAPVKPTSEPKWLYGTAARSAARCAVNRATKLQSSAFAKRTSNISRASEAPRSDKANPHTCLHVSQTRRREVARAHHQHTWIVRGASIC